MMVPAYSLYGLNQHSKFAWQPKFMDSVNAESSYARVARVQELCENRGGRRLDSPSLMIVPAYGLYYGLSQY